MEICTVRKGRKCPSLRCLDFSAKLWISYFEDGATVPPPFNIVPSPKSICYGCSYMYRRVFGCSKAQLRNRWQSIKV
jgi:hypothetical protein